MKKTAALLAIAAGIVAGCSTIQYIDKRVVVAEDVVSDISVTDIKLVKPDSGFSTVQVNVKNLDSDELAVQWKTVWFDINGIEVDSITSAWNDFAIQPGDIKGLKHTAPSKNAVDARVYIRSMRH